MDTFGLVKPQPKMSPGEVTDALEKNGQTILGVLHAIHAHANKLLDNNGQRIDKTVKRMYNSVNARLRQNSAKLAAVGQALTTHVDGHLAQNQAAISAATSAPGISQWYRDHMGLPDYTPSPPSPPPFPMPMPPAETGQPTNQPTPIPPVQHETCVKGGGGIEQLNTWAVYRTNAVHDGKLGGAIVPVYRMGDGMYSFQPPPGYLLVQYLSIQDCDAAAELEKALADYLRREPDPSNYVYV